MGRVEDISEVLRAWRLVDSAHREQRFYSQYKSSTSAGSHSEFVTCEQSKYCFRSTSSYDDVRTHLSRIVAKASASPCLRFVAAFRPECSGVSASGNYALSVGLMVHTEKSNLYSGTFLTDGAYGNLVSARPAPADHLVVSHRKAGEASHALRILHRKDGTTTVIIMVGYGKSNKANSSRNDTQDLGLTDEFVWAIFCWKSVVPSSSRIPSIYMRFDLAPLNAVGVS